MKLLSYHTTAGLRLGALSPDQSNVIDLNGTNPAIPAEMLSFLQNYDRNLHLAQSAVNSNEAAAHSTPLSNVKIDALLRNPQKIMAIGRNYVEHSTEQNKKPPERPILFAVYPSAIIAPGETISWSDTLTQQVDFEGELAVIIGRPARRVAEADALDYVAGYSIANDVTARDIQAGDGQFTRGKSLDTFLPLGPYLTTADEVPDPQALHLSTTLNNQVMQDDTTGSMIFTVRYLISYLSQAFTLLPGDILITGTPSGVGRYRNPPVFLKTGDVVAIEIEGLGHLSNPCQIV